MTSAKIVERLADRAEVVPSITAKPVSQTVTPGQTATFTVAATGTATLTYQWRKNGTMTLTYQWRKNGTIISGATSPSYTTPAATASDNDTQFTVTVANATGDVTSTAATLTVNATVVAVTVSPNNATVTAGSTQQFIGNVTGSSNTAMTWTVSGAGCTGVACGTISSSGLYIPPPSVPSTATVTVTATSVADPTKSASVSATIVAALAVLLSISPASASLPSGGTQLFAASVTGTSNTAVSWSVTGAGCSGSSCGSISTSASSAVYLAPTVPPSPASVNVLATSLADPTKSASASVTIAPVVVVAVSPTNNSIPAGMTQQFDASVTGTLNTAVTWSIAGAGCSVAACGTINSSGLYNAPSTVPSPVVVTISATSVANPTIAGTANLTILPHTTAGLTTVTLNGQSYTLQPHPRVFFNSSILPRIAYTGSAPAPKAVSTNPPWVGTQWIVNYGGIATQYNNANHQADYLGGVEAAATAMDWYSDNTQTTAKTIALYMLNNIEQFVPFLCDQAQTDCVANGGTGYGITSYGAAYWLPNWIFAYELMRGQMTTLQQETFADKILNDQAEWGGIDGSPSTNCTNPTVVSPVNVTVSGGTITAASALFGSGNPIQANYWIAMDNAGALGYDYGKIASVTDSTHAVVSSDQATEFNGYSGVLAYRRNTWSAGDCGFLWHIKHDEWTAAAITDSTNYPPSGGMNSDYPHNLTISSVWGMIPALLSVADDDDNFSSRSGPEITALYNAWYDNVFTAVNEAYYAGRHQTGSTYGIWRADGMYPGIAFAVANSTVSGPSLTNGVWAKNMLYHYFMNWLPGNQANEPQWGQDFASGPNFDVNSGAESVAELITMYPTSNEGEWANWWMRNVLSAGNGSFQNTPGTNLSWSTTNYLWTYHNYGDYAFVYAWTDPAYATANLSTAPTAFAMNQSDSGTYPSSMLISRTGYTSYMDTLVNLEAPSEPIQDHNLAIGGWTPGNYKIYKGYFLLGSDNGGKGAWMSPSSNVGNAGGPFSMYMEIGGKYNLTSGPSEPYVVSKMPYANTDGTNNRFAYAMVDSTQAYLSAVNATRVQRHFVDFKKPSTQQFIIVYDDVVTSSGQEKQTYLHYLNNSQGLYGQGTTTFTQSSCSVSSSFAGFLSGGTDATQLLTQIVFPAGSSSGYCYVQNADGTYTGRNGDSFRVSICASTTGSSCNASNTEAEFVVVHEPVAGTGNTMPPVGTLSTVDSNHRAVQVQGSSPKVAVFPRGGTTYTSATFTSTHGGTAQYVIAGLTAGTYSVSGPLTLTNQSVDANGVLYLEGAAGTYVVSRTGP